MDITPKLYLTVVRCTFYGHVLDFQIIPVRISIKQSGRPSRDICYSLTPIHQLRGLGFVWLSKVSDVLCSSRNESPLSFGRKLSLVGLLGRRPYEVGI
ncbi:hypothetical protein TNCT_513201 [Trichonephila clavata]|uniref:Uncharacterized protein n=1 Tax=Trichonephila clavata TaxID=2740835 RepID=A0A8X6HYL5_TRICU|nr:hypothetical protein TNCT_513201 [Trichonephila clavata]